MAWKYLKDLTKRRASNTTLSTSFRPPSMLFGVGLKPHDELLFGKLKVKFMSLSLLSDPEDEIPMLMDVSDAVDTLLQKELKTEHCYIELQF